VGQDGILPPIANRRSADIPSLQRRVTNPLQIADLPHSGSVDRAYPTIASAKCG
jgi:hypothetical protein